ncbi:hypothetical protein V1264_005399 [Littorina saxatilis]|uniref:P2X purinoreceptor 7 intracellular domain-containing protein n=3 Tax=Littorina saxatilis TaxID=31220 RepID=A0AAN9AZ36_9CAEN
MASAAPSITADDQINPYMFEPPASLLESSTEDEGTTSSSGENSHSDDENRDSVSDQRGWCQCGHCVVWEGQKRREKMCCRSYPEVERKLAVGQTCITSHEGVQDNCFSRYTIESVVILLKQSLKKRWKEEFENKAEPHRTYRHVAYCNFVRWIWHTTGRKNRKILPACLVAAIRDRFPSQSYTGFKYAT